MCFEFESGEQMIILIYVLVIILSNIVGSISGLGGGSIIKPMLDAFHFHSVSEISLYSSVAVLLMAISSTLRQMKNKVTIDWKFAFLNSLGAFVGGLAGQKVFDLLIINSSDDTIVNLIQIIITIITLFVSYYFMRHPEICFNFKSDILLLIVGFSLGLLASLLGIGGGPLNVSILIVMFGVSMREATIYSIITILFSQISKLGLIYINKSYIGMDLNVILYVIPAAIIGGTLGAKISGKLSEEKIKITFTYVLYFVMLMNFINMFKILA